jgi:hypothetical protein
MLFNWLGLIFYGRFGTGAEERSGICEILGEYRGFQAAMTPVKWRKKVGLLEGVPTFWGDWIPTLDVIRTFFSLPQGKT